MEEHLNIKLLMGLAVCVNAILRAAWVMATAALVLWSVNTLSPLDMPYSVQNVAAVAILLAIMRRIAQ